MNFIKSNWQTLLILVLCLVIIFQFLHTPYDKEKERLIKANKALLEGIESRDKIIERSFKREQALKQQYEALEHSRAEAEQNTNKWRKRYENEKNSRPVPYNDAELDSLLTAWYGR